MARAGQDTDKVNLTLLQHPLLTALTGIITRYSAEDLRFHHLTCNFWIYVDFDRHCNLQCSDPDEKKMLKTEGLLHSLDWSFHTSVTLNRFNSLKSTHVCAACV